MLCHFATYATSETVTGRHIVFLVRKTNQSATRSKGLEAGANQNWLLNVQDENVSNFTDH